MEQQELTLTKRQKEIVERQFVSFLKKTIRGIRLDYLRKERNLRYREILVPSFYKLEGEFEMERLPDVLYFDLEEIRKKLNKRQRFVLDAVIICGATEAEAARFLNVTQQFVNTLKKEVVTIIKEKLEE